MLGSGGDLQFLRSARVELVERLRHALAIEDGAGALPARHGILRIGEIDRRE
jgi:hypothetical protein